MKRVEETLKLKNFVFGKVSLKTKLKAAAISIVAFETPEDRDGYSRAWKAVTGFHKGKSCHLSGCQTTIGNRPMRHVTYVGANGNHKGKA